ncbi:hypothetical protein G1K52_05290 [Tenacibaculum finnmarkense]|uniref:hypothetical protein n=1 Tax=Tenacibaculum finnmarkense TaxID=2781243 RepID=UPI001EFA629B|nr:hypothetical protein [Tenacibaculum finnmarkense]MCG8785177.1 hypothetical protein [Tenacibaculum finnmarkense]
MKKVNFKIYSILILIILAMVGCSKDDKNLEKSDFGNQKKGIALWVVTDPNTLSGVLIPSEEIFTGEVDPSTAPNTIQLGASRTAGISFGNAIYNTSNASGDVGIQKFSNNSGILSLEGFVSVGENRFTLEIVNETKGYYTDSNRSQTAIQIFNPTSMERTGEIDIADAIKPYKNDKVTRTRLGSFMVESKGKLYTQVFFFDADGNHVNDVSYVAVFDTTTDKLLNITSHNDYIWLGFERKNSNYIGKAENGDIYLSGPLGNLKDGFHSRCVRIKAGTTNFDDTWKLDYNNFVGGEGSFSLGGPAIVGNKLYIKLKSAGMKADYSNIKEEDLYPYEIDINTKQATKIEGIPGSGASTFSISAPVVIEEKVYFSVSNSKYQGYYTYDPTTKKVEEAFTLTGGLASQLISIN